MLRHQKLALISCLLVLRVLWTSIPETNALDNGLALTPPMGFNNWQRFRCNTDCKNYPDSCISEKLFMTMADAMVARGYLDAGYQYVNIDDCWFADHRDNGTGRLEPNAERFPSGMKALADYIHSKGLKLGVYQDVGNKTCAGFPGLLGYEQVDAQTYAEWGVDYVKVDGCNIDPKKFDVQYPLFGKALNETGRPIVYSCEWPHYQNEHNISTNFTTLRETCNLWRNYYDVLDSFSSVESIMDYMGENNDLLRTVSGPGGWNDADMLNVGDYGLSLPQSQAQFALWAILAAPLLISADIRNMRPEFEQILMNKDIIAVNQDPLGIMGERIDNGSTNSGVEIWRRPITPTNGSANNDVSYSFALAFWCRGLNGYPIMIEKSLAELGLNNDNGYTIKDLYGNASEDTTDIYFSEDKLQLFIEPSCGIVMLRATLAKPFSERIAHERRLLYGDVLPYHDSAQLVAKEAWEEFQRQSAGRQQGEGQQFYPVENNDDDCADTVYPAQQFDVDANRRTTASEWVSRQRVQFGERLEKLRRYFAERPFDLVMLAYLMACCFVVLFSLTAFVIVRTTIGAAQHSPDLSSDEKSNQKALRINSVAGKPSAAISLDAQIDARRTKHLEGKTDDVFLPKVDDAEYDDGFDEENKLHDDEAHRYVGTVEAGRYVRP